MDQLGQSVDTINNNFIDVQFMSFISSLKGMLKRVQEGNHQEKAQSERRKTEVGKLTLRYLYLENISYAE